MFYTTYFLTVELIISFHNKGTDQKKVTNIESLHFSTDVDDQVYCLKISI